MLLGRELRAHVDEIIKAKRLIAVTSMLIQEAMLLSAMSRGARHPAFAANLESVVVGIYPERSLLIVQINEAK